MLHEIWSCVAKSILSRSCRLFVSFVCVKPCRKSIRETKHITRFVCSCSTKQRHAPQMWRHVQQIEYICLIVSLFKFVRFGDDLCVVFVTCNFFSVTCNSFLCFQHPTMMSRHIDRLLFSTWNDLIDTVVSRIVDITKNDYLFNFFCFERRFNGDKTTTWHVVWIIWQT